MYTSERPPGVDVVPLPAGLRGAWRSVGPNVWFLGLTSLLTDVSSEMVTSVLPLYVVVHLGLSPLAFGLVDGLQHGLSALLRMASGTLADRSRRHKEVAAAGYAVSAASRLALLFAGASLPGLAAAVAADRIGKGFRTAPRDALISLSARRESLGAAFGVHRSLDAAGAALGPLLAFALLAQIPNGFQTLFGLSFLVALAGLGAILLLVSNVEAPTPPAAAGAGHGFRALVRERRFRSLLWVATAVSLATVGDGFLYLALQRRASLGASAFPLLFVGTSLAYFVLAAPAGRLADRLGRDRTFLAGTLLLLPAYATSFLPGPDWVPLLACMGLLGASYAATDGVLAAMAAALLPPEARGRGLALLATAAGLARLGAALGFGALWQAVGFGSAVLVFGAGLAAALLAARRLLAPAPATS